MENDIAAISANFSKSIDWIDLAFVVGTMAGAVVAGLAALWLTRAILRQIARRTGTQIDDVLLKRAVKPGLLLFPAFALSLVIPALALPDNIRTITRHVVSLLLIAGVAWLIVSLCNAIIDMVAIRFRLDVRDNLEARRMHTQVRVLMRSLAVLVIILAAAAMLMTFPQVRQLGLSILASAGVAGLVVGFAARPVLQNLIAGVQIALTQPIRIDDVVIVQGEWGRIEEISSTYVVVRVWDQRRLIVPLNWFVENVFQNWTRTTADITGTVFLYVDYRVPVETVRQKLHQIIQESGKWDGKGWALQVTDATESTVQLRALVTAADGPTAWELRCYVREKLLEWLQREHPESLPRVRAIVEGALVSGKVAKPQA